LSARTKDKREAERLDRVKRALANPIVFAEAYVRPYDKSWKSRTPQFAMEMMHHVLMHSRSVVILPAEFMKTTMLSQVLPLWLTVRATVFGEMLRGMLASEEQGLAENNLSVLSWHIENNELLASDFVDAHGNPLVYPDPDEDRWREDAIIVKRHGASKDPTWQAKGLDSKGVQGRRLDWLIADDLITPKNASSPTWRKRAVDFWDLQFTTRLVEGATAVICGNFNDPRDLLSSLAARESYALFKRPAIHQPGHPDIGDENGELTWPENWSRERLDDAKRDKPNRFKRLFLCDADAEVGERLKVEWVQLIQPEQTPMRHGRYFMYLDPAPGGGSDDLDFFNCTVACLHGLGPAQHLDIIESYSIRADVARQIEITGQLHDTYDKFGVGVIAIGGSRVAMDRFMRGTLSMARPDLEHKLVDVPTPGSKEERLESLGPYAKTGYVRVHEAVWYGLTSAPSDQWQELSLFEEWRDFPQGKHDDRLDGLDGVIRIAREFSMVGEVEFTLEAL
jgi:hypothetical protein